jgi:hypothetical protein
MTEVVATDDDTFTRFLAAADEEVREVDADEVSMQIIARILKATSVDDILEGSGAVHARDFVGVPFTLTDVRFNKSDFQDAGPAFYALLEGADGNGERVTITCGARNVIAQAWKLRDMGALPVQVQLGESERPTAKGYKVLWLEKAGSSF